MAQVQISLVPATLSPHMSSMSHDGLNQQPWGQFSIWHIRPCHDITCHGVEHSMSLTKEVKVNKNNVQYEN